MYSLSTYRGQPFVRTQRSSQFRWMLMGVGALALGTAGTLAYSTFTHEYQQERQIAETAVIAEQVAEYKPAIASALTAADDLAAQIGNEVADPSVVTKFAALRNQARAMLAIEVAVPTNQDGAKVAYVDREVANSTLVANAAMVTNLSAGEAALRASHEAYQELVNAKADAAAARAQLEGEIPGFDNLLFDTAPSIDGWIYVPEELRIPLAEAIQEARNAVLAADNKELSSVADYQQVAANCRAALAKMGETGLVVYNNIKLPVPVVPLDENGNPIPVEAAPVP